MLIILIPFVIILFILLAAKCYIQTNLHAYIKYYMNGSIILSLLFIIEYVLGSIILIKVIMKII